MTITVLLLIVMLADGSVLSQSEVFEDLATCQAQATLVNTASYKSTRIKSFKFLCVNTGWKGVTS